MTDNRFPGRWLGGCALVLGPLVMVTGVLLRAGPHFFFPDQLAAYQRDPVRMDAAYSCFVVGDVLLWPAIAVLAQRIAATRPTWAVWGGALATFGLFDRAFHGGADHLAFQLVRIQGVEGATRTVAGTYGAYYVLSALGIAIMAGWVVLAAGAWRAGVLGPVRALYLAAMSALPIGVLKGTTVLSVVAVVGLTIALVPEGIRVLRDGPRPAVWSVLRWTAAVLAALTVMVVLGNAG